MPILFHTGAFGGVDWANLELDRYHDACAMNCQPIHLDRIAHHFPRLNMIAAHMGGHWAKDVLFMTQYFKNIFADWTGGSCRKPHNRAILSALLPHPGLETNMDDPEENLALGSLPQFCFGTDNPEPDRSVPASEMILDRLHATEEIKKLFYYNNAARMLGLEEIA
jgi:predicted TIM-barrel fold metal-dependent hydrolase